MNWAGLRLLAFVICFLAFLLACSPVNPCTPNVRITLTERITDRLINANRLDIFKLNPDGTVEEEVISSAKTDDTGVASFCLTAGVYRAIPAGSFGGSLDFSLSEDGQNLNLNLTILPILN